MGGEKLPGSEEFWKDAKTLPDVVFEMVQGGLSQSAEFKAILAFYGRERIKQIYLNEARKRRGKKEDEPE